jgi:CP family cyanate transporter-like MFS transporter
MKGCQEMIGQSKITKSNKGNKFYQFMLIIGVVVIAFNLRPAITSVGPLLGTIRDTMGLSNWNAGLLTSLPLIAFAVLSPVAPKLGNRFTNERVMFFGFAILLIGICIRSISVIAFLFAGTILAGCGIAFCNVLLPGLIKDKFPLKVALMTSIYSTSMGIFASAASGLSIPLAKGLNLGWQISLLVWAAPVVIGMIILIYLSKKSKGDNQVEIKGVSTNDNRMWRSLLAWQVALFMGFQSFLFYVTISWLPEILHDYGVSITQAGWLLSFTQFIGLPASFIVPVIAGRFKSQRGIVFVMGACAIIGYSGLLLGHSKIVMMISITLIGITLGGAFALALAFLGMRARNAKQAAELSGMAQSLGYALAAFGPMVIGYLFDLTHDWEVPLITLIGVTVLVVIFGVGAGRDKFVLD